MSRKWVTVTLTPEPNQVSVRVLFLKALAAENLLTAELEERLADPDTPIPDDDDSIPMLLAISDNWTEMRGDETRRFMALMSIAQHFGRPSTPTDQAWIETLWGHLKWEHPHLLGITDPAVMIAELERLRHLYNDCGSTKPSATSPPTTNTKAAATPSAPPASTGYASLTSNAATGTAPTETSNDYYHQQQPVDNQQLLSESTQQLSR